MWNFDPSIILGLTLFIGAYLIAIGPLRNQFPNARPVPQGRVISFLLGALAMFIALASPIDEIGDHYLFSVHMVQHLLLMLIMPPLVLLGIPGWLLEPILQNATLTRMARFVTRPVTAIILFNTLFALYHIPALYDLSLQNHSIHIVIHLLLMATATISWMPILSPTQILPRLSYPLQIMYLFLQAIPPTLLAALITFADTVLYPTYARAPRIFGGTALEDQQNSGLIMWIPGTAVYLLALTIVFFKWFGGEQTAEAEQAPTTNA